MTTKTFKKDQIEQARAMVNKAEIQIGEGTVTNQLPIGEHDAEYTGEFQVREGKVVKDGPNKGKSWAATLGIFKVKGEKVSGKVSVQLDLAAIEKLEDGKVYKIRVTTNLNNPEYKDVRMIEA